MTDTQIIALWSPVPMPSGAFCMDFFASFVRKFGNVQCLHCQTFLDRRTANLLKQADLVVIPVHQDRTEISLLFSGRTVCFSNCIYLIVDYVPNPYFNLDHISFEFRIPANKLACIPYNPSLHFAVSRGFYAPYRTMHGISVIHHDDAQFRRTLKAASFTMLRALGF